MCVPSSARTPPTRPAAGGESAARAAAGRPCAPRPPLARPAADAAHTPRYRLRAPQSAARPAAALAPRSSATCSARPPRQTEGVAAANAVLAGEPDGAAAALRASLCIAAVCMRQGIRD
jgi:hypothetical protein